MAERALSVAERALPDVTDSYECEWACIQASVRVRACVLRARVRGAVCVFVAWCARARARAIYKTLTRGVRVRST